MSKDDNNMQTGSASSVHTDADMPPQFRPLDTPPFPEPGRFGGFKSTKGITAVLGALLVVLLKFKWILIFAFTKLKFLLAAIKLSKFAGTFISMTVMIWVYAQMFGWMYGVGFVILLLIHEMGHYVVARQLGLNTSLPIFIPFMGAFIALKDQPRDAVVEAKVALGGPILGSIAALLCVPLYLATSSQLFLALAYTGFFLNLFNLIPIHPLDGGRAVSAISPWLWLVGIPLGGYFFIQSFNPIILMMLVLGIFQILGQWKNPNPSYYQVAPRMRAIFAVVYFGLICALGIGMTHIHDLHVEMYTKQ